MNHPSPILYSASRTTHKEADLHKCGLTRKDLIQKLPSLASRSACTATSPSQNMALKATETLWRYNEDFAGSLSEVKTLQMVRVKNCQIRTGTHKSRDFLCCSWLLAGFKVNMIQKSHCLHRDFSDKVPTQSQH